MVSKYSDDSSDDSSSSDSGTSAITYSRETRTDLDKTEKTSINDIIQEFEYKPRSETTYECLMLTNNKLNSNIRGAGFRPDGKPRQIKRTTLLSKVRTRCLIRERKPALAICITMYNEEEKELQETLKGLIHNYNCIRADDTDRYKMTKDDFLIFIVCDGYDRIPESFKQLGRDKGFLNEQMLIDEGFMTQDPKTQQFKFRDIKDLMDPSIPVADHP